MTLCVKIFLLFFQDKDSTPMSDWTKPKLVAWFKKYHPDMIEKKDTRDILWKKALKIKTENPNYIVDDMIKDAGFIILRTPPYHCEINPIGK